MEKQDPSTRLEAQIEGEIEIEGIVRLKENEPSFLQKGTNPRDFRHRFLYFFPLLQSLTPPLFYELTVRYPIAEI